MIQSDLTKNNKSYNLVKIQSWTYPGSAAMIAGGQFPAVSHNNQK